MRDPDIATGEVMQRLAAVWMFSTLVRPDGNSILVARRADYIPHVAVLAFGCVIDIRSALIPKISIRCRSPLLAIA